MDQYLIMNATWLVFALIGFAVNLRNGYRRGITDSHTMVTVPVIKMLIQKGYIVGKNKDDGTEVSAEELAAYLILEAVGVTRGDAY